MRMKIAEGRRILRGTVNKTNTSSFGKDKKKEKDWADEMEQNLSKND